MSVRVLKDIPAVMFFISDSEKRALIPWPIDKESDVKVYIKSAAYSGLVENKYYKTTKRSPITGGIYADTIIVGEFPFEEPYDLIAFRDLDIDQNNDFTVVSIKSEGYSDQINRVLDKLVMKIQELSLRCLRLSSSSTEGSGELPNLSGAAGKVVAVNDEENGFKLAGAGLDDSSALIPPKYFFSDERDRDEYFRVHYNELEDGLLIIVEKYFFGDRYKIIQIRGVDSWFDITYVGANSLWINTYDSTFGTVLTNINKNVPVVIGSSDDNDKDMRLLIFKDYSILDGNGIFGPEAIPFGSAIKVNKYYNPNGQNNYGVSMETTLEGPNPNHGEVTIYQDGKISIYTKNTCEIVSMSLRNNIVNRLGEFTLYLKERYGDVVNPIIPTARILPLYFFETEVQMTAYFLAHPSEMLIGTIVSVNYALKILIGNSPMSWHSLGSESLWSADSGFLSPYPNRDQNFMLGDSSNYGVFVKKDGSGFTVKATTSLGYQSYVDVTFSLIRIYVDKDDDSVGGSITLGLNLLEITADLSSRIRFKAPKIEYECSGKYDGQLREIRPEAVCRYIFNSASDRDNYFNSHPNELEDGLMVFVLIVPDRGVLYIRKGQFWAQVQSI